MKKVRARPRRIPAFGEWNYYDDGGYGYGDGDGAGDWPVTQCLDSAMQAGLFVSLPTSPKPLKKVVKWSDSGTLEVDGEQRQKVVVGLREEHGPKKEGRGKPIEIYLKVPHAADGHLSTTAGYNKGHRVRAVKAVDEDLYVIPPDMLCHNNNPRKRLTKRLWIGCLGCVSA
ncbi:hypothetical protein CFC21_059298 [Triticum aestivum]|uniref:RIN4 pathogenic type III effector avirulence factor Avr cleavage site domain-containing protein n=2 Tax=Triticum aestivum TaxID=4565 RepID=A0A9R1KEE5_WHEAT|nr:uncharacterized protein LOC123089465 [Triticum aestivum]KAF7051010.1 hypothetical protein CFC21_059297 [Triticum aestivum]KAF7051011.1 hypothetical protein CFC21_059298 [Triticum aestivum]